MCEENKIDDISYIIRKGLLTDESDLKALYRVVAAIPGGLARAEEEITDNYIHHILTFAVTRGLIFVAEHNGNLVGSILKYRGEPKVFSHVLMEGSILVNPAYQGRGIGTALIKALQNEIMQHHPEIMRVELVVRESNPARNLYKRMGFVEEGRFEKRIKGVNGDFEADIPMAWINPRFDSSAT